MGQMARERTLLTSFYIYNMNQIFCKPVNGVCTMLAVGNFLSLLLYLFMAHQRKFVQYSIVFSCLSF